MSPIVKAAFAYTLPVFALAFAIGAARVSLIAPVTGPLIAVGLEVPVVLSLSWIIAGRIALPPTLPARAALALISFALLMTLEFLTALSFGQTPTQFLTAMSTPAGALGLAGQIGFALIPLVRQARG